MSDAAVLGLEPEDLDGHTVEELTDYLERGREPADPSIDDSPACRMALGALQRLHDLAGDLLDAPGAARPRAEHDWIGAVLAAIPIDARAGRRFPLPTEGSQTTAHVTEGAIRGLVRAIGDDVPGLLVGSVRLRPEQDPALRVEVAVVHGLPIPTAVAALRSALRLALDDHVPFRIDRIDVDVVGLIVPPASWQRRP